MSFHREYENPYRLFLKLRLPCEHIKYNYHSHVSLANIKINLTKSERAV